MRIFRESCIIFVKECVEGIRDIRSTILTFVLPLFLFPLLVLLLSSHKEPDVYRVAGDKIPAEIISHLQEDSKIAYSNQSDKISEKLKSHQLDAAIITHKRPNYYALEINYNNSVKKSIEAMEFVKAKLLEHHMQEVMKHPEIKQTAPLVVYMPLYDVYLGSSMFILFSILPLLLIVVSVTSPMALATDLFAGEKERGSLEILLSSGIRKRSILLGKFSSIFLFGLGGVSCFICGFIISFKIDSSLFGIKKLMIERHQLIEAAFIIVLAVIIFSALETLISLIARTTKEAQLYIIPITVVSMALATVSEKLYFQQAQFSSLIYSIPVLNIVHILRDIVMRELDLINCLHTTTSSLIFSAILLYVSLCLLSNEKIVYRN